MITKQEVQTVIDMLDVTPMHDSLLVLVQRPQEKTDSGIIKSSTMVAEEKLEQFLTVIAVAEDVTNIVPFDKIYVQGTVITFSDDNTPEELDIAPEGYTIGLVPRMYAKMKA